MRAIRARDATRIEEDTMCAGCQRRLPQAGTRFMLTIRTDRGGDEVAFCSADCRRHWCLGAGRRASGPSPRKAA